MSDRNGIDSLVGTCTASLSGPTPAGRDLTNLSIDKEESAKRRYALLQVFQDSRNANWGQVYDDALSILRDESKDVLALWGVLAPLPIIKGHGFQGVAISIELCREFLERFWDTMYPTLPDGMNLRVSVFGQLVKKWSAFARQAKVAATDAPMIQRIAELIDSYEAALQNRIPAEFLPPLGELRQLIRGYKSQLGGDAAAVANDPAPAGGAAATASGPLDAQVPGASGYPGTDLEAAFQQAWREVPNDPRQVLARFGAMVELLPRRSLRFRGRVYLSELCLRAGETRLARQVLSLLDSEVGSIKLEDWEPELCGRLWAALYRAIAQERAQAGSDAKKDTDSKLDELYTRVCRVDSSRAIALRET